MRKWREGFRGCGGGEYDFDVWRRRWWLEGVRVGGGGERDGFQGREGRGFGDVWCRGLEQNLVLVNLNNYIVHFSIQRQMYVA